MNSLLIDSQLEKTQPKFPLEAASKWLVCPFLLTRNMGKLTRKRLCCVSAWINRSQNIITEIDDESNGIYFDMNNYYEA